MNVSSLIVWSLLASGATTEPSNDAAKARELVKQLGDAKFKVRDSAEKELLHLGLASLPALEEGEKNADLHVQEHCRILQPTIRALTLSKRVEAFLADRNGTLATGLPFVKAFVAVTGDSKEARQLYAEVLQSNAALLDEAERDSKKGIELFTAHCQEVANRMRYVQGVDHQARQRSINRADVALFFLLARELAPEKTGRVTSYGYNFMNAPVLAETLAKNTAESLPFKKMFLAWLESESASWMVQRGLQVAVEAKMKEALPFVLKSVKDKKMEIHARAQTALLLAKIGTKEHLKDIEPLLDDKTLVGNFGINNMQGQVQMRDVGLAVSIKLSGRKMSEYDFDVMKGNDDLIHMSYVYCAFSSDAKREAAHKKYKASIAAEAKK